MSLIFFFACSDAGIGGSPGVSPGGSQDIGYARQIIEAGGVPSNEAFTAEGLFSEHDLPLTNSGCEELLCPLAPAAWTDPVDGRGERLLLQVGFDTFIVEFERRPLNMIVALDISGSMDDSMDGASKLEVIQDALDQMAGQLTAEDTVGLVVFDDATEVELAPTAMDSDGRRAFRDRVAAQVPSGGTDIETGLARAYGLLPGAAPSGTEDRVILLTDAQPNVGATGTGSFLSLVRDAADRGIGTTVMGVGLDFGSELADAIAKVRGGNAYYLDSQATAKEVMVDEFDYVVTPAAYDLSVEFKTASGFVVEEGFGTPVDAAAGELSFGATTLFFSDGDGGMGLLLDPVGTLPEEAPTAQFSISYEDAETGEMVNDSVDAVWSGGAGFERPADDIGPYKMAVLLDEYLALSGAADWCTSQLDEESATDRVEEASVRLSDRSDELEDVPLRAESALMAKLRENMQGGRANCQEADAYNY